MCEINYNMAHFTFIFQSILQLFQHSSSTLKQQHVFQLREVVLLVQLLEKASAVHSIHLIFLCSLSLNLLEPKSYIMYHHQL